MAKNVPVAARMTPDWKWESRLFWEESSLRSSWRAFTCDSIARALALGVCDERSERGERER